MLGFPLPFPGSRRPCKPRTEQRGAAGRPGNGAVKNIFETLLAKVSKMCPWPSLYRVFFFTGPPPKKLKYEKLRLGEVTCI